MSKMRELIEIYRMYVRLMHPLYAIHVHGCVVIERDGLIGIVPPLWCAPVVYA